MIGMDPEAHEHEVDTTEDKYGTSTVFDNIVRALRLKRISILVAITPVHASLPIPTLGIVAPSL
jgi:hypothetical protein